MNCKGVTTPGSRDDVTRATRANDVESLGMTASTSSQVKPHQMASTSGEEGRVDGTEGCSSMLPPAPPAEATKYRAVSARLNYLCQEDLMYESSDLLKAVCTSYSLV